MLGGYDMVRRRVRHKSKAFNVFMMLLFVACLFVIGKQEYSIYQIKQEQAATQQRIAGLQKQKTELEAERKPLTTGWHVEARQKVEGQMRDMAKSLERDPQLETALRNRGRDLGMGRNLEKNERVSQELQKGIARSRSQGLGLGM